MFYVKGSSEETQMAAPYIENERSAHPVAGLAPISNDSALLHSRPQWTSQTTEIYAGTSLLYGFFLGTFDTPRYWSSRSAICLASSGIYISIVFSKISIIYFYLFSQDLGSQLRERFSTWTSRLKSSKS